MPCDTATAGHVTHPPVLLNIPFGPPGPVAATFPMLRVCVALLLAHRSEVHAELWLTSKSCQVCDSISDMCATLLCSSNNMVRLDLHSNGTDRVLIQDFDNNELTIITGQNATYPHGVCETRWAAKVCSCMAQSRWLQTATVCSHCPWLS